MEKWPRNIKRASHKKGSNPVSPIQKYTLFWRALQLVLMLEYETRLWETGAQHVAGVDEAGRGALAGPVVAAAVILPHDTIIDGVRDSKTLTAAARTRAFDAIYEIALWVGVGQASPREIDELNVLKASLCAMERALERLGCKPDCLLIDGNRVLESVSCRQQAIIGGDRKSHTIAAASIVAKVVRDSLMRDLHKGYPSYGWNTNMGYPTQHHYEILKSAGPTLHHRLSFRLE